MLVYMLMILAGCCDGNPKQLARQYIQNDGGDPDKAICGPEDGGWECNYYDGQGRPLEIECSACGCSYDD